LTAIGSGVPPQYGLYTAVVAGLLIALTGGARFSVSGPTAAFIVILHPIAEQYGMGGLVLASLMAGVMLLGMGIGRMGKLIQFIPYPVTTGFTAGIGVVIWVSQWKDFFGLPAPAGEHFHEKLVHLLQSLPQLHPATTGLAVLSLLLAIYAPRVPGLQRVPGPLVAMVAATILQATIGFEGGATIASAFGGIPQSLPHFVWPALSLDRLVSLVPAAFTIAMLGAIESLLSASVADGMAGTRHDSNQELIGQGIANVISPLFGGIAATGAIARTATSFRNGATNPLAGIVHSVLLLAILLLLAPLAGAVPLAALAAILFLVAWNMSEARHFMRMVRTAPRADVAVMAAVFALTVVSVPLLLDRRIDLHAALVTSLRAVGANPLAMALWAAIIMVLTALSIASLMLGLAIVVPWLAHASWHAYRDLVDTSGLVARP